MLSLGALISLAIAVFGVATAVGLARVRLTRAWRALTEVAALGKVSAVALEPTGSPDEIRNALPALAGASNTVVGILPLKPGGQRARIRVGAPATTRDLTTRSAAASLAALSLAADDVPEFEEAVRSRKLQRGSNLTALLRRGQSSLPALTRDKILQTLVPRPYWVVPVTRATEVVALILVITGADREVPSEPILRAARRLAWMFLPAPAPVTREGMRPVAVRRQVAPAGAEIVLWLDPTGRVATYEALQETWGLPESPPTLGDLLGSNSSAAHRLMQRARHHGHTSTETATLSDGTIIHLSLLALSDVDDNVWGYAALLQRAGAVTAPEPLPAQ